MGLCVSKKQVEEMMTVQRALLAHQQRQMELLTDEEDAKKATIHAQQKKIDMLEKQLKTVEASHCKLISELDRAATQMTLESHWQWPTTLGGRVRAAKYLQVDSSTTSQ
jgi:predicted RNase H-like nuclease (RuvC/YqgF family)